MGILGLTRGLFNNGISQITSMAQYNYYPLKCLQRRTLSNSKLINGGGDEILPVLIVGAGPVGLVLSILLTKLGIKCSILEKSKTFSQHPQAHFINNRSMEIFRKLDDLSEKIQIAQPPVELWRKFIYCTSLTGPILGAVDHMKPQDFDRIVSPVSVAHFSQYKLTDLLIKQLKHLNFNIHSCEKSKSLELEKNILMGHECLSIDSSHNNHITVTCSLQKEDKHAEKNIKCRVLVGADGARSRVRKLVGIEMIGEKGLQKLVSVHFLSKELGKYLINERPGMLFFIFNSEAIGVLVAHDLKEGEFVLQIPYYPPQQKLEDFDFEICKRLIFKLVGRELIDLDVKDVKPWVMHAEVAEKFLACDNRIILAGDAAHRFPPAGGFGMNTGIQDAHNLAWKLGSVISGITPNSLLDTYEMERRPVALFNTELSVQNFKAAMAVPSALGLDPTIANTVHRVINDTVGSILPSRLQSAILDGIFSIGRAQLSDSILNENNPLGSSRLAKLRQIFEEGKSLQLQFPAEDLGFRYLKGAIVANGSADLDPPEAPTGRRRDYIPSAMPGSRLPHMNVRAFLEQSNKATFSTLDLIPVDKVEFLLIIAPIESSYKLALAALNVAEQFKVSLKVCVVWPYGPIDTVEVRRNKEVLIPWENYIDVMEVKPMKKVSSSCSWWDICSMTDKWAILVRPDEHIAWRAESNVVIGDPILEMKRVFSIVLGVV